MKATSSILYFILYFVVAVCYLVYSISNGSAIAIALSSVLTVLTAILLFFRIKGKDN